MKKTALTVLAAAAILLIWLALLRPVSLGGSTSYATVAGVSMEPGLHTGDLVIARAQASYRIGDVVVFRIPDGFPERGSLVVHRIVGGGSAGFIVQGDNKAHPDPWRPAASDIVGRSWIELPALGNVFMLLRSPVVLAATLAGLTTFWIISSGTSRRGAVRRASETNGTRPAGSVHRGLDR